MQSPYIFSGIFLFLSTSVCVCVCFSIRSCQSSMAVVVLVSLPVQYPLYTHSCLVFCLHSLFFKIMPTYPFDFHFTSAIVSRVSASLKDAAICQRAIREVINVEKARKQHQDYIAVLRYSRATHHSPRRPTTHRSSTRVKLLLLLENWVWM